MQHRLFPRNLNILLGIRNLYVQIRKFFIFSLSVCFDYDIKSYILYIFQQSSQESQSYVAVCSEPSKKRRRLPKKQKIKKEELEKKPTKEVDLLALNCKLAEVAEEKLVVKREQLEVQKEILNVLKSINENLSKIRGGNPTAVDLFNSIIEP